MERLPKMLQWFHTWIGVNNIYFLTPEGLFGESHGMKGGKNKGYGIWMSYHVKGTFLWAPDTSLTDFVLRKIRKDVQKLLDSFHVFICST